jgi:hypothetical protein
MDESLESSGWSRLKDWEIVKLLEDQVDGVGPMGINAVEKAKKVLEGRGLVSRNCAECGEDRLHQQHDYICMWCRHANPR